MLEKVSPLKHNAIWAAKNWVCNTHVENKTQETDIEKGGKAWLKDGSLVNRRL